MMMDVLPISLGLETADGGFDIILPRNSKIPVEMTKQFMTADKNQEGITVEIYEGEDPVAKNNHYVGYFNFVVPKSLRDKCSVEDAEGEDGEEGAGVTLPVTFALSDSGCLQVRAGTTHESLGFEDGDMLGPNMLLFYIISLFLLYAFCRIYFADVFIDMEYPNAHNDPADGVASWEGSGPLATETSGVPEL
jgi:molecular chaperone DnaK (HSP70)